MPATVMTMPVMPPAPVMPASIMTMPVPLPAVPVQPPVPPVAAPAPVVPVPVPALVLPGLQPTADAPVFASVPGAGFGPTALQQAQQLALLTATAQAQHTQYLQQCQFWQQLQAHEAQQRHLGAPAVPPPLMAPPLLMNRFKDGFRPMRLCRHIATPGLCRQGDQCTFAHDVHELHTSSPDLPRPPPPTPNVAASAPEMRLKKKRELCSRFAQGRCTFGQVCPFAHGDDELNCVALALCGKVKTQLCRSFEAGRCVLGANCFNAHGDFEIGTRRPEALPMPKRRREDEQQPGVFEAPPVFRGVPGAFST
eukprot:NODE_13898_length_1140_cov_5.073050.p1 GENE.NODE_13898_length_1140_cov_5.073050~~NODE_13898_length_1140_cov_5.073050.p1  ORF type:complete len:309 (+),score=92.48 NODE_13898_length_1140_cov_5.073050:19-945(+)